VPRKAQKQTGGYNYSAIATASLTISSAALHARARPSVVIELNLPPAETADHAPAILRRERTKILIGHWSQNPEFRRMNDENLGLSREPGRDLVG